MGARPRHGVPGGESLSLVQALQRMSNFSFTALLPCETLESPRKDVLHPPARFCTERLPQRDSGLPTADQSHSGFEPIARMGGKRHRGTVLTLQL